MPRFQSLRTLQTLYGLAFLALVIIAGVVGTTGLILNDRLTSEAARIDRLQRIAEEARSGGGGPVSRKAVARRKPR